MLAGLSGCSSKQRRPIPIPRPHRPTTKTQPPRGSDLSKIMKSASAVKQMSYDITTTMTKKMADHHQHRQVLP